MQAFNYSPSASKKSIASIATLKSDGSNILEGYCYFCGKKITQAYVRREDAVPVPTPSGKMGWSCSVHNHGQQ